MDAIAQYLAMGGYARFVWPAYGVAVLMLAAMAIVSLRSWRRRQRLWYELAATRRR